MGGSWALTLHDAPDKVTIFEDIELEDH